MLYLGEGSELGNNPSYQLFVFGFHETGSLTRLSGAHCTMHVALELEVLLSQLPGYYCMPPYLAFSFPGLALPLLGRALYSRTARKRNSWPG